MRVSKLKARRPPVSLPPTRRIPTAARTTHPSKEPKAQTNPARLASVAAVVDADAPRAANPPRLTVRPQAQVPTALYRRMSPLPVEQASHLLSVPLPVERASRLLSVKEVKPHPMTPLHHEDRPPHPVRHPAMQPRPAAAEDVAAAGEAINNPAHSRTHVVRHRAKAARARIGRRASGLHSDPAEGAVAAEEGVQKAADKLVNRNQADPNRASPRRLAQRPRPISHPPVHPAMVAPPRHRPSR